jgi:hypothetical protein
VRCRLSTGTGTAAAARPPTHPPTHLFHHLLQGILGVLIAPRAIFLALAAPTVVVPHPLPQLRDALGAAVGLAARCTAVAARATAGRGGEAAAAAGAGSADAPGAVAAAAQAAVCGLALRDRSLQPLALPLLALLLPLGAGGEVELDELLLVVHQRLKQVPAAGERKKGRAGRQK